MSAQVEYMIGQVVLAKHSDGKSYSGTVLSKKGDLYKIRWKDGNGIVRLKANDISPLEFHLGEKVIVSKDGTAKEGRATLPIPDLADHYGVILHGERNKREFYSKNIISEAGLKRRSDNFLRFAQGHNHDEIMAAAILCSFKKHKNA